MLVGLALSHVVLTCHGELESLLSISPDCALMPEEKCGAE